MKHALAFSLATLAFASAAHAEAEDALTKEVIDCISDGHSTRVIPCNIAKSEKSKGRGFTECRKLDSGELIATIICRPKKEGIQ